MYNKVQCLVFADGQNKPPVCNQTYISRSIIEGVPIGTTVLNFRDFCWDPEGGPLKYQLNDNANQQFAATTSNLLITNKAADAEARLSYAPSFYASPWTVSMAEGDKFMARSHEARSSMFPLSCALGRNS